MTTTYVRSIILASLLFAGCKKNTTHELTKVPAVVEPVLPTVFKTMEYNIHLGVSPSTNKIDLQWIADVINNRSPKPDLVALVEVDYKTVRSGIKIDQAAVLAEKTGMYYAFFRAEYFDSGQYGNAILSRYPIRQKYIYSLPQPVGGEPRTMGMIEVMVDGKPFNFAVTHLDHLTEAARLPQAEKINEMVAGFRYPVILGGDFNAQPTWPTILKLKEQLTLGCPGTGCPFTLSSSDPYESVDHFFYKSTGFDRLDYYTVQTLASDHLALIATWTLK